MTTPGQRFHNWAQGYRVRYLDPRVVTPDRRGVELIQLHDLVATYRLSHEGIKPELVRYVAGIGEQA